MKPRHPRPPARRAFGTVWAVTLGCPKNRVDTEVMLGDLLSHGYALTSEPEDADVVLVNTCGFLAAARDESLAVLDDVAGRMRPGARLVAAGCMTQQFRDRIREAVPRADVFVGVHDLLALRGRLEGGAATPSPEPTAANPRLVTTPARSAYLKIADGCSRRCAFCIIPRIRGRQRSRPVDDVLAEARALAASGVREAVLVAQDLTHYGTDLPGTPTLADLVRRLADDAPGLDWIRLMYLYPRHLDDALLDLMAGHPRVLKYLDIPVQHGDDRVLKAMRRGTTARDLLRLVARIRARVPGVVLRTTYLVGHPGETDDAFEALVAFAQEARFEMAGVFPFSPEPGSHAAGLDGQVPVRVRRARATRLEAVLSGIAADQRAAQVGQVHDALVEEPGGRGRPTVGRFWFQAPEVDGVVRWTAPAARAGDIVPVRIVGARDADYLGEPVAGGPGPRASGRGGRACTRS